MIPVEDPSRNVMSRQPLGRTKSQRRAEAVSLRNVIEQSMLDFRGCIGVMQTLKAHTQPR